MEQQQAIVLFYKYFSASPSPSPSPTPSDDAVAIEQWWNDPRENVRKLYQWHETNLTTTTTTTTAISSSVSESNPASFVNRLPLVGRILIAPEGINGTVSGNRSDVEEYVERLKDYSDLSSGGTSSTDHANTNTNTNTNTNDDLRIFRNVDYKVSYDSSTEPLFPDLKISIVKEIVSTSGLVHVHDVPLETGKHLTPEEFHEILEQSKERRSEEAKEIALIDVRNTFEHEIGYFVDPKTNAKAIDPETTTFSSFDKFCEKNAELLRHKKVMMYCTGGIRCEKASVLLKRRGVEDVNQLSGGIHRYLEKYGNTGHFKGLNFTFDKRVAMKPNFASEKDCVTTTTTTTTTTTNGNSEDAAGKECGAADRVVDDNHGDSYEIVGRCVACNDPFDELCGSRVCTVCRDLVLVCDRCRCHPTALREYHCKRHSDWKHCYFSFLEIFDRNELADQRDSLRALRDNDDSLAKNVRRTLTRQIDKVETRMRGLREGTLAVDRNAPRRCRSCQEPLGEACDGKCWGFWRKAEVRHASAAAAAAAGANENGTQEINADDPRSKGSAAGDGAGAQKKKVLRGRRVKQKLEAELEFLPRRCAATPLSS